MITMTSIQKTLLTEAIQKHNPEFISIVEKVGVTTLTENEREDLRGAIASELCETGLGSGDEPNQRGLVLEELIDVLGYM